MNNVKIKNINDSRLLLINICIICNCLAPIIMCIVDIYQVTMNVGIDQLRVICAFNRFASAIHYGTNNTISSLYVQNHQGPIPSHYCTWASQKRTFMREKKKSSRELGESLKFLVCEIRTYSIRIQEVSHQSFSKKRKELKHGTSGKEDHVNNV